ARFWFQGNYGERWTYFMRFDGQGRATDVLGEQDVTVNGLTEIDNSWLRYKISDTAGLKFGVFASVFNREQASLPSDKLAQDNSPTATVFDTAVFEGFQLDWSWSKRLNTYWVISNGQRSTYRSFSDPANADIALTQHTELLLAGDWAQFTGFTSPCCSDFGMKIGGTVDWEENRLAAGQETDIFYLGGEISLAGNGWMFWSTIHYWKTNWKSPVKVDDMGFVLMGSRYLNPHLEWYGRYDAVLPGSGRATLNDDFRTATTGLTYYPKPGYNYLKLGFEINYFLDPSTNTLVSPSNSIMLLDSPEGDQWAGSFQVSWVF
ncbi:MAG: hypothetical protein ACR2NP_09780, partial [Pirellulaceae bacterium]